MAISDAAIPLGSKAEARTQAEGRAASKTSPNGRATFARSPLKSSVRFCATQVTDSAVIRAASLLLERGYGRPPAFHTNDPGQFRDVLEMTDAEIRDRLAVIRGLLIEHGIDPLALPSPRGNEGHQ